MYVEGSAVPLISSDLENAAALTIIAEGMDAQCGLPCCCSVTTKQFQTQYFIPPECSSCISVSELSRLVEEGNHILRTTHMPLMPIIFLHFCIPFAPICITSSYTNSRQEKLRTLCKRWNDEVLLARKCHLQMVTFQEGFGSQAELGFSLQLIVHPGESVAFNAPQQTVEAATYASPPLSSVSLPMYEMSVPTHGQQTAALSNQAKFQPVPTAPSYAR